MGLHSELTLCDGIRIRILKEPQHREDQDSRNYPCWAMFFYLLLVLVVLAAYQSFLRLRSPWELIIQEAWQPDDISGQ